MPATDTAEAKGNVMIYSDPRVLQVQDEIARYGVAILPILPNLMPHFSAQGSGTFLNIIARGERGGRPGEDLDVAWLELHPRAAAKADRSWLDVSRMRTHSTGDSEDLLVFGAPQTRWS